MDCECIGPIASQSEAEEGVLNDKAMTPLRVKQAIEVIGASQAALAASAGAAMIGVEAGGNVQQALDDKAPAATTSLAVGATRYPVDFRLGRDAQPHPFEFIPATQHSGIVVGTSTYDCSEDLQAMLDSWTPDLGKAGIISFPLGRYALAQPLLIPNWVAFEGVGRGSQFYALSDHSGPYMFQFDSDPEKTDPHPSSHFNSFLRGFDINANSAAALDWIVYAPSWNEKCGLHDIVARDVEKGFLLVDEWHGGSSGFPISNLEVFFTEAAYDNGRTGIRLRGKMRNATLIANRPLVTMQNVSLVGGKAGNVADSVGQVMMEVDNVDVQFNGGIRFEKALFGVIVANAAQLTGHGLAASDEPGRVVNLLARDNTHDGHIDLRAVSRGSGGVRAFRDFKSGAQMSRTDPIDGHIGIPSRPGEAWADGKFVVASGAISGTPELRGCSGVTRNATGYYQVTHSDAFPGSTGNQAYYVECEAHDDTLCQAHVRASERNGGSFFIRVYRLSDGTLFDPAEVTFRVYRKPGF